MKRLVGIICVVLGFAANASAASIVGTLNFGGTVTVTGTTINWHDDPGPPVVPGLILTGTSTGYFADLDDGATPTYASSIDLVAPTQVMPNFLSDFTESPVDMGTEYDDLSFDLTDIIEPTAPPCMLGGNTQCSLGVFTITPTAGGHSVITMDIAGLFRDPTYLGGATAPATGVYSAQRDESVAEVVAFFGPNGPQSFTTTYSASITAVPEPATLLTFGAGTALLAAHRRRRAKKSNA